MTIIILLAALALVLGILEIFILPGFGIAGIGAVICALIDAVLIYQAYGFGIAAACTGVGVAVVLGALWWVARSRTFDRVALHSTISSTSATAAQLSVRVGDEGESLTRLALVGNARIGGQVVEVKSSGSFIDPHTPIRVISVSEALITVEAI